MNRGFRRMAAAAASTKRNPAPVAGKTGKPEAYLSGLKALPPMPASKDVIERYQLKSPRDVFWTALEGSPDVLEGDELTVAGAVYRVRGVGPWPGANGFLEILLERSVI